MADTDETGTKANRWHTPYLLLLPGIVALILFFVIPLFSIAQLSLQDGGLSNYSKVLRDNRTSSSGRSCTRRWPPWEPCSSGTRSRTSSP